MPPVLHQESGCQPPATGRHTAVSAELSLRFPRGDPVALFCATGLAGGPPRRTSDTNLARQMGLHESPTTTLAQCGGIVHIRICIRIRILAAGIVSSTVHTGRCHPECLLSFPAVRWTSKLNHEPYPALVNGERRRPTGTFLDGAGGRRETLLSHINRDQPRHPHGAFPALALRAREAPATQPSQREVVRIGRGHDRMVAIRIE
ncbi:hypothetical protein BO70DRAFT_398250 [Aspergillus heteromorphus CBS 117.55]|uniref:Uncharacterized protein n=1 Tax=Aspergillus heteromorphus CBS 117.55 TaxID=1448321 RepID=A0A317VR73_9EURO|nr:uncharacterized protein BO70DRAFT_398250 [Aspergillus heteromorphus CBS 117.55]PWY75392.1 hypothetical protein BO70DRAFT_398250 [Aspergillus heteromorphus CBS 117.55]